MNRPYEKIELENRQIEINGHKVTALVRLELYYDENFELDWDFEPGEKEKLVNQINNNILTPTGIVVKATALGEEGFDSCWGFLFKNLEEALEEVKSTGFVDSALKSLEQTIQEKLQTFAPYYKKAS